MTKAHRTLRVAVIVLGGILIGMIGWRLGRMNRQINPQSEMSPIYGTVADFTFTEQNGQPFGLGDLKNKIWVADFFFTQCMGPCPMLTTKMAELQKKFSDKKNLHFVSFSVDPDHDTPKALSTYAASYGANGASWHFLTGPKEKIYKLIRESFHLAVEASPPEKPSINDILHSLYFVLVDGSGNVKGYFNTGDPESMDKLNHALANS